MTKCANCQVETTNPKFCSRSCNVSYNNRLKPKRIKNLYHCACGNSIGKTAKQCRKCLTKYQDSMTLKEATYQLHHRSSAYALVRTRARAVGKKLGFKACSNCGYDKHFEVAHIKAIKDFDENTPINVINHPSNIKPLCPNCHWESDSKSRRLGT